jgi:hypothetical protein
VQSLDKLRNECEYPQISMKKLNMLFRRAHDPRDPKPGDDNRSKICTLCQTYLSGNAEENSSVHDEAQGSKMDAPKRSRATFAPQSVATNATVFLYDPNGPITRAKVLITAMEGTFGDYATGLRRVGCS